MEKPTASFHQFCKANNVINKSQQGASSYFLGDVKVYVLTENYGDPLWFESLRWNFFFFLFFLNQGATTTQTVLFRPGLVSFNT